MKPSLLRRSGSEFFGTFVIVMASCGSLMVDSLGGSLGHLGTALSPGLAVMIMIFAVGHLCGAHFNPAVTLAFAVTRHFPWREVPVYFAGQILGAVSAALLLRTLFGPVGSLGANIPAGEVLQSLGIEIVLTAVLMFVIISVATDSRAAGELAAVAIGITVALNSLWAGPISGASMNPARAFGPAFVGGFWQHHWIYWVGPPLGAVIGAVVYEALRRSQPDTAQNPV